MIPKKKALWINPKGFLFGVIFFEIINLPALLNGLHAYG